MKQVLESLAKTKPLIILCVLSLVFSAGIFPNLPYIKGLKLDVLFSYDLSLVIQRLTAMGEEGREVYLWSVIFIDMIYPLIYSSFFAGLLYRLRTGNSMWALSLLPFVTLVIDVSENLQFFYMLHVYPELSATQVSLASIFTSAKWVSVAGFFILLVFSGVVKIRGREKA